MIVSDGSNETRVDEIRGLSPTIAINQKTVSNNPRSTVGTITEIYDYYRLLYTTIGKSYCPNHSHILLKKHTLRDVVEEVAKYGEGEKIHICIPLPSGRDFSLLSDVAKYVADIGFVRFQVGKKIYSVAEVEETKIPDGEKAIIIDRLVVKHHEDDQ
jgi:excinuclease ABC subunit A